LLAWPESISIACPCHDGAEAMNINRENGDHDAVNNNNGDGDGTNRNGIHDNNVTSNGKKVYCNVLPNDLVCARGKIPSSELVCLLTNKMPPLHFVSTYACDSLGPQRIVTIQFLDSIFPSGATFFYQGLLPFHCACRAGATQCILEWWWEKYPMVIQTPTMDTGDFPLYCYLSPTNSTPIAARAINSEIPQYLSAMQFLLQKQPEVLCYANILGHLPFHIAALHQVPLDALFHLACQDPEALLWNSSKSLL